MPNAFRAVSLVIGVVTAAAFASTAAADTIKVLTTGAVKSVVVALGPAFEAQTGHKLDVVNDTAGGVAKRVEGGEAFDVVVLTPAPLRDLAAKGKVVPDSVKSVVKVGIGIAVKNGAPMPEVKTVEQFRALMLASRVAYIDPAAGGSTGIYLTGLFEKMGIANEIKARAVLVPGGLTGTRVVSGEADVALQPISELLQVQGITIVGPLPEAIQSYIEYAIAVSATTTRKEAAQKFVALVAGPAGAETMQAKGMLPLQ